jgi:UDP-N-acetylmuramate dehydrogenase
MIIDLPAIFASNSLGGRLLKDASLAEYTSWRTGGRAEYIYVPENLAHLQRFLSQLPATVPLTWLGLGSNTLVRDGGVEGVVIITQGALNTLTPIAESSSLPSTARAGTLIRAEAGVASAQLARYTARAAAAGLEFMAGIPGTVGGALAMNAGCFGGETWNFVHAVETINRRGDITLRPLQDFHVTYRHVVRPADEWFVAGHFLLPPGDKQKSLEDIRVLLERRSNTQPTGTANCGSVFRNPPGDHAGRLIEECGLKGKMLGGACVSQKHANFIINEHNASAVDIENLITEVRSVVEQKTGIQLITEVHIIGKTRSI